MTKFVLAILIFALPLLPRACGGKIIACETVTAADAANATGKLMRIFKEQAGDGETRCVYRDTEGEEVYLEAVFRVFPTVENAIDADDIARTVNRNIDRRFETLNDIGDTAWLKTRDGSQTVFVRRGKIVFFISITGKPADSDALTGLARQIAAQI